MHRRGNNYRLYAHSCLQMPECKDASIGLTVTSPPYWNAIDYDIHAANGKHAWHRQREYAEFGRGYEQWLGNIQDCFREVLRATMPGGFCAIVIGTILHKRKHYPAPFDAATRMVAAGWEFHQDIVWNKVTGGVKRAGSFIQHRKSGYYYPNIMTEYVLVFRKPGEIRRGKQPALDINDLFTRDIANNVWHIAPIPPGQIDHPCPYPQELVRRLVALYSEPGDEILDPFIGSGQTALVALQQGRRCVGFDTEPAYIDLTAQRIANPPPPRANNLLPRFEKVAVQ